MNLEMFKFAIEHISRVSKVLFQDNGKCLHVRIGRSDNMAQQVFNWVFISFGSSYSTRICLSEIFNFFLEFPGHLYVQFF